MNNKGFVGTLFVGAITVVVLGGMFINSVNTNIKTEEGEVVSKEFGWTELSKKNGSLIKCKFLNKGEDYCNDLYN